jgi:hypothetical protein
LHKKEKFYTMKKLLLILILYILCLQLCVSQEYETLYSRSYNGKFCGEEAFSFTILEGKISKKDKHYGNVDTVQAQRDNTTFDDDGVYIENWSEKRYYNFRKLERFDGQYYFTFGFDKKGGNLLFIKELRFQSNGYDYDRGKIYYTKLGYERFCKKY